MAGATVLDRDRAPHSSSEEARWNAHKDMVIEVMQRMEVTRVNPAEVEDFRRWLAMEPHEISLNNGYIRSLCLDLHDDGRVERYPPDNSTRSRKVWWWPKT